MEETFKRVFILALFMLAAFAVIPSAASARIQRKDGYFPEHILGEFMFLIRRL